MLKLGDYNTLRIVKSVEFGLYLDGGEEGEILLPQRYVTKEFACLEVAWVNQYGAFLKWGLMKDLFCPFREQKQRMTQGQHHIIYIKVDEDSYRLMATAKVEKQLLIPTAEDLPSLTHGTRSTIIRFSNRCIVETA